MASISAPPEPGTIASSPDESENHDRFSTSAICHELLRPITLRVAVLPLDSAERITALHHQPQPKVSKVRVFSFVASGGGLVLVDQSQDESHDRPIRRPHFARDSCGVKDAVSVRKAERCRKEANKPKTPSPRILATSIGKLPCGTFHGGGIKGRAVTETPSKGRPG